MVKRPNEPKPADRPLAYPIILRDGQAIETLKQAIYAVMHLPDSWKEKDMWIQTASLLVKAEGSRKKADIEAATDQLSSALAWWGFK